MKKLFLLLYFLFSLVFLWYLAKVTPPFPTPPPGALQSMEPGDTETTLRRAYFTNYTREQVMQHYKAQYNFLPIFRFNYPPEEAGRFIRELTRSSYLEELVHPFRTSLFINGFIPSVEKDVINIKGQHFEQKITIRLVESSRMARAIIGATTLLLLLLILMELQSWRK